MDGNAPRARPRGQRRAEGRVPRAQAARTRSRSARTDTRPAGTATRATGTLGAIRPRDVSRCSRSGTRNGAQRALQLVGQHRERLPKRAGAADDHEGRVRGRGVPNRTVGLAQATARSVSLGGTADLPTHGESRASRLVRRLPEYDHRRPVNPLAPLEERLKISAAGQPFAPRKSAGQTVSRFRPFARRRLSTFRPPLVFIRSRKP
jgi:hypothetical protein